MQDIENLQKMRVLDFALTLINEKITSELISDINKIFNCKLKEYDGDRRSDEIIWEAEVFGLELELSQQYDEDVVFLHGNSEKICAYMPLDYVREFTNIDEEILNLLKVLMPKKNWMALNEK